MSIAAAQISPEALYDMLQLFDAQPWTKRLHEELAELWALCISRNQQLLLRELIKDFCMLDADKELNACKEFNTQIQDWKLNPTNTWVVAVANADEIDGSTAGLQKLKNKVHPHEEWHSRFISNIPSSAEKINNGDNVILFDDFIGTGKKMARKILWLKKLLLQRGVGDFKIFCACFTGMQFGIKHLIDESNRPVFASISLKRGISERYVGDELTNALSVMKEIEGQLGETYRNKKLVDYTLGFEQSETLYCAANDNCPNNVFPILWWSIRKNKRPFKTLLQRAG